MRRATFVALVVSMLMAVMPSALAHNSGHVNTGNGGCVPVGSGNAPPEGAAIGNGPHARGIHHAIHAGPADKSAVLSDPCV